MDFGNRLKGKITQGILEGLLEDVNYRIVPLGIEEVVRELKSITVEEYLNLGLPAVLRSMPDFFIAKPDFEKKWLVEVKFRQRWNPEVRAALKHVLEAQVRAWQPLYLVLFVGEPVYSSRMPACYLRVAQLEIENDNLVVRVPGAEEDRIIDWDSSDWGNFSRFQDVFPEVRDRWQNATISRSIELMKRLNESINAS